MTQQAEQELGPGRCALLTSVLAAMVDATRATGLEAAAPDIADAAVSRNADPADGSEALTVTWRNARGERFGEVVFNGDGSFFAEYDVVCPHPRDKRWFVEAVTAWGREGAVKTELRLLPAL